MGVCNSNGVNISGRGKDRRGRKIKKKAISHLAQGLSPQSLGMWGPTDLATLRVLPRRRCGGRRRGQQGREKKV